MKISETIMVSIDIAENDDEPVLCVYRNNGTSLTVINTIIGPEAVDIYSNLVQAGRCKPI